jgi:hypothetical protein
MLEGVSPSPQAFVRGHDERSKMVTAAPERAK